MKTIYVNKPNLNTSYTQRIGAYGLLTNDSKQIAVVKTSTGYFLPGGGLEVGETLEVCLKREFIEEIALAVDIVKKYSVISFYFFSTTLETHMESIGHFYECRLNHVLNSICEEDHCLVWLSKDEATDKLYLKNQREAVLTLIGNDKE